MLVGYVSDENYSALSGAVLEFRACNGASAIVKSAPSGAVYADIPPGSYEVILVKPGFGSKRVQMTVERNVAYHFRLLSDGLLGYAWPKWSRGGDTVEFRVHAVEQYKLGLWRYGFEREFVQNIGWYDNHGPRAAMQTLPDGHFVEQGVAWDNGFGTSHRQTIIAPDRSGLYYFHAHDRAGRFNSFPLVVAPLRPTASIAVLAATNTWNAYNPFGGRSNYILAEQMIDTPIVNSKTDLPRYRLAQYGEWNADNYAPISFDRPEPANQVGFQESCTDPIEGRSECHLAPAEWRLLAWLEREHFEHDFYADYHLHDGSLNLDAYRVLVLGPHPEYWSATMYRRVKEWVFDRGGRLVYLGGNGINCEIEFLSDGAMRCLNKWDHAKESRFHTRVESEANLLGVVYSDPGAMTVAPYEVLQPEHWAFAGTGLAQGDRFGEKTLHERYGDGASGHETDKISPSSPHDIQLLARGLNPDDGGAHMSCFTTRSGGEVFAAGSITYTSALLCDAPTSRITSNVLRRFMS